MFVLSSLSPSPSRGGSLEVRQGREPGLAARKPSLALYSQAVTLYKLVTSAEFMLSLLCGAQSTDLSPPPRSKLIPACRMASMSSLLQITTLRRGIATPSAVFDFVQRLQKLAWSHDPGLVPLLSSSASVYLVEWSPFCSINTFVLF